MRRALAAAALGVLLAGCAEFPDSGPREWRDKVEGSGELGGPPLVPTPNPPSPQQPPQSAPGPSGAPQPPSGCVDPDPQVVATCLNPVGAIAVLPDSVTALVAERATGRVLQVRRGVAPVLVTTVPTDTSGGGGLTGLVLSPSYVEDQLLYAYVTTPTDNRVVRIAAGEPPKPVLTGIPRGATNNMGALSVDVDGSLLVATGDAGRPADPASLAGKVLRIDTLGRPARGNPDPASPVLSSGVRAPGGICTDPATTMTWVTDRTATQDVLHLLVPGPLPAPAWTWPDRPGVAGCMAQPGVVTIAQVNAASLFVLRPSDNGAFTGAPETILRGTYGRLWAAALAPDGLLWLGTVNKDGGNPVPADDRVIRIQPPSGGGESRA
ncbi:PQQ-dependent sugar dehydrogenase [Pseudonocardia sp. S2-4]|uniref:PQQ-dependent sugar dehydrogenase n=2 Tax=Pseudonocardia humida TaxID=2800819 RepID=A0ABT1AB49_9PSEU|nr:PQQ-dependent sugar dehydrogenase [Pseudonocardia humida]